jgi:hypothetical protein
MEWLIGTAVALGMIYTAAITLAVRDRYAPRPGRREGRCPPGSCRYFSYWVSLE